MKSRPTTDGRGGVGELFCHAHHFAVLSRLAIAAACLAATAVIGNAGESGRSSDSTTNLAELSIEQLVNLKVTSVSKKEEKLNDAAAAIFVLNNDDLRRSGATTVAEALRLVPGASGSATP